MLMLTLGAVAACGGNPSAQRADPPPSAAARPALLREATGAGEVVVRGETSPKTAGPYPLHGTYNVRFQQYAPEAPETDFTSQTPFVVDLERSPGTPAMHVFKDAAETGRSTVTVDGRMYVDVSFGDFPFVIRFTPVRR